MVGRGSKIIEKRLNIKILSSRQFQHWSFFQTEINCLDPLRIHGRKDEKLTCLMTAAFSRPADYLSYFIQRCPIL